MPFSLDSTLGVSVVVSADQIEVKVPQRCSFLAQLTTGSFGNHGGLFSCIGRWSSPNSNRFAMGVDANAIPS